MAPRVQQDDVLVDQGERLSVLWRPPVGTGWVPDQPGPPGAGGPVRPHQPSAVASPDATPGGVAPAGLIPLDPEPARRLPDEVSLAAVLRSALEDRLPLWALSLPPRSRTRLLSAVAAALLAVIVGAVLLVRHHAAPGYPTQQASAQVGGAADPAAAAPTSVGAGDDPGAGSIVVDVGGRVRRPGLVTLPAGARVADALAAAGGARRPRDVITLDLAAKVGDGQLLLVGAPSAAAGPAAEGSGSAAGSAAGAAGSTAGPGAPVDLNTATVSELDALPGVGPVTAQKILDWRSAHNGFTSVSQLQQVPGIGPARYSQLQPLVTA